LIQANEEDTLYTTLFDGGWPDAPHRVLRNSTVREWEAAGSPASGQRPGEGDILTQHIAGAQFPRYDDAAPMQGLTGDVEAMALYAGQSVGLIHTIEPVQQLIKSLIEQANSRLPAPLQFSHA
jgi:nitronate monooxygenase